MRAVQQESLSVPNPADELFEAALGVAQNAGNVRILAVHTGGRKLVVREKSKFSNPKFIQAWVEGDTGSSQLHVTVGTDPRSPKALLDGKANQKSLSRFLENVQGALDGSAPAPASPVADHFLQKKAEVPWTDPSRDPEIELDGNFLAGYAL